MTIEIHRPEVEALIEQRMASGRFESVEDVIAQALRSSEPMPMTAGAETETLDEMFARARGLADDLDFGRTPSTGRPVTL